MRLNCFASLGLRVLIAAALLFAMPVSQPVYAVQPDEILKDPKLEKRARKISLELRCLVCQNQSIDDSDAPLARDLRLLVRERLKEGDSNSEVIDFVVSRYGEFVLLRPPFGWHTLILWLAPGLVLIGAIFLARSVMHRSRPSVAGVPSGSEKALSEAEEAKLKQILDEGKQG